jgi:CDP-diacylglycerol--glycerol-3-phosphate 3-phosphatidyltransferase
MSKLSGIHPREVLYPSNLLTIARLLLLPATISYLRQPDRRREALICLGAAMFTDAVDGPIARQRGEVSRLGEILDPIADKLLIDLTAITLSQTRGFPWWITGLLLFRDVGIILAALVVIQRRAHITTSRSSGKLTTAALALAALLYIADGERSGKPALYAALVPFGFSFVQYGKQFVELLQSNHE